MGSVAEPRLTLFEKPEAYEAFVCVLEATWDEIQVPIFAMVVMSKHFVAHPLTSKSASSFGD